MRDKCFGKVMLLLFSIVMVLYSQYAAAGFIIITEGGHNYVHFKKTDYLGTIDQDAVNELRAILTHNTINGIRFEDTVTFNLGALKDILRVIQECAKPEMVELVIRDGRLFVAGEIVPFGDEGTAAVADFLRHNKYVTTVNIPDMEFGDAGLQTLAAALEENPNVTALNLGRISLEKNLTVVGWQAFLAALAKNKSLKSLTLKNVRPSFLILLLSKLPTTNITLTKIVLLDSYTRLDSHPDYAHLERASFYAQFVVDHYTTRNILIDEFRRTLTTEEFTNLDLYSAFMAFLHTHPANNKVALAFLSLINKLCGISEEDSCINAKKRGEISVIYRNELPLFRERLYAEQLQLHIFQQLLGIHENVVNIVEVTEENAAPSDDIQPAPVGAATAAPDLITRPASRRRTSFMFAPVVTNEERGLDFHLPSRSSSM